jgi:hypothetical protein
MRGLWHRAAQLPHVVFCSLIDHHEESQATMGRLTVGFHIVLIREGRFFS